VALAVAAGALASRYLPITNHLVLFLAAASPYFMLCAPVSVVLLMWGRRWVLAIGAVGLTVATFAVEIPLYLGSDVNRIADVEVRVMSANIREGDGRRPPSCPVGADAGRRCGIAGANPASS
jgi:hypothetical protein